MSDGTAAGTHDLATSDGTILEVVKDLVAVGDRLFFFGLDSRHGMELWVSDGTASGTHIVTDLTPGPNPTGLWAPVPFGNLLLFNVSPPIDPGQLWRSDGTKDGTFRLAAPLMDASPMDASGFLEINGTMFFSAEDLQHGRELWRTDGTNDGTQRVADINSSTWPASPHLFRTIGGELFFEASDTDHGPAIWRSDGTETGTQLFADFDPAVSNQLVERFLTDMMPVGHAMFSWFGRSGLWRTELATGLSRRLIKFQEPGGLDSIQCGFVIGGRFYFVGVDLGLRGVALWTVDEGGVPTVVTQLPGISVWGATVLSGEARGRVYLRFHTDGGAYELWTTDGTGGGTVRLHGQVPYDAHVVFRDQLYFICDSRDTGAEICRTDGTPEGTVLFRDTTPGYLGNPGGFVSNGALMFFFANDGTHGFEPWVSDGTPEGTHMLKDIASGPRWSFNPSLRIPPGRNLSLGGKFVFRADDRINGEQVWITDGTEAGTRILAWLAPPGWPSRLWQGQEFEGFLYFTVDHSPTDYITPVELWRTDGTSEGTVRIDGLEMGVPDGSDPEFTVVGDRLFFNARDLDHDWELWTVDSRARRFRRHLGPR